jgi:glycosyltransferase involved in cell wall biosynthesis
MSTPLIIVSYWFAPSPAVGGKRFSFLSRELARLGYDVHVITHDSHDWSKWSSDSSLPQHEQVHRCSEAFKLPLERKSIVHRACNALLRPLMAAVGWEYFWARSAERTALAVAKDLPPGVVIATYPAPAALIAGARIARKLGWPLILDYRDPWSTHVWPSWRRGALAQWLSRKLERRLVRQSQARVLNTPAMRTSFQAFLPEAPNARNFVIPNGFSAAGVAEPPPDTGPVRVVHAGEIFTGRSLVPVLEAARRLAEKYPARPIRLVTYGDLPAAEMARIRARGLEAFIEVRQRIPFAELFAELQRAHLLVAVVGDHMPYSTPYKVYDYMAAGRPILGLAPQGAALFDLLAESGAGECCEREDSAAIEAVLERLVRGEVAPLQARVDRFRWENLASQYRAVIETVAGETAALGAPLDHSAVGRRHVVPGGARRR